MLPQILHHARSLAVATLLAVASAPPEAFAGPLTSTAPGTDAGTPAPGTPSGASAPEPSCARGRRVQVKPQELKKKVRAATSGAELKALLEPLGMNTEWIQDECTKREQPSVVLDVFRARIMSADAQDFVLQARGRVCESVSLLDGVVLHPLEGKDTFCAIGMPFLPGVPDAYHRSITFGFENLTDPVRQVFRVESTREDPRNTYGELSYWEAQGGELRSIFSIESGEHMGFQNAASSVKVTARGSGFPRELHIQESSRSCGRFVDMPSGHTSYTSDCTEAVNEVRQCYQRASPGDSGRYGECP
jgi:hypothetical protein